MVRIALISDIHSNEVALRAVLAEIRRTGMGHEDAFPRPRLSARYRFSQRTFAGPRGNGRDAP